MLINVCVAHEDGLDDQPSSNHPGVARTEPGKCDNDLLIKSISQYNISDVYGRMKPSRGRNWSRRADKMIKHHNRTATLIATSMEIGDEYLEFGDPFLMNNGLGLSFRLRLDSPTVEAEIELLGLVKGSNPCSSSLYINTHISPPARPSWPFFGADSKKFGIVSITKNPYIHTIPLTSLHHSP